MQHERPPHLGDVQLSEVDPFLRSLLFTDGTVTRALEVQALSRIFVEVVAQSRSLAHGHVASYLDIPDGMESIERRVIIGVDTTDPVLWAESHILPERLPGGFLGLLDDTPNGIGDSLQQVKLESWRDMLWYGLDYAPDWDCVGPHAASMVLRRLYRIITQSQPALLISESFAIEQRSGIYHLAGI